MMANRRILVFRLRMQIAFSSLALSLAPTWSALGQQAAIPTADAVASCAVESVPAIVETRRLAPVSCEDVVAFLTKSKQVSRDAWLHEYSHVALSDHLGTITLRTGEKVHWLIRPGGLGVLTFADGKKVYLVSCCER
jgi:hypothetical protein